MTDKEILQAIDRLDAELPFDEICVGGNDNWHDIDVHELLYEVKERINPWHYPSKGEIPDKDWSKHPANISKECWVVTKRGVGTIARWDNDYRMWFERPRLAVIDVIAWQYFVPPKKEYTY